MSETHGLAVDSGVVARSQERRLQWLPFHGERVETSKPTRAVPRLGATPGQFRPAFGAASSKSSALQRGCTFPPCEVRPAIGQVAVTRFPRCDVCS